jgi:hypothetical protein
MQCWFNVPATGRIDDKIKMVNIHLKTNIPSFSPRRRLYGAGGHHSIIPFPEQIRKPEKPLYSQKVIEIPRR